MNFIDNVIYVKALKNGDNKATDLLSLILGILFGGPAMLFFYSFSEVRDEDALHKYRFLILGIIYTIIEIVLIIILFSLGLINLN